MPRTYLILTQDEIDLRIAEAIKSREIELMGYDFEAESHQAVVAAADAKNLQWTPETEKYKGLTRDQMVKAATKDGLAAETLASVAELNHKELASHGVEAVKIETAKSEKHLATLLALLPAERRDAAFAALAAKEATAKAVKNE